MERRGDKVDIVQRVSCWISDMAFARFKSFSDRVLGIQIGVVPCKCSRKIPKNLLN